MQIEAFGRELGLARFERGEIDDLGERSVQASRRLHQRLGVATLCGIELAVEQELGHGNDRLHRRVKLAADDCEKIGFGGIGRFRGLALVTLHR